jgi:4-aminobutyrate aminotransferase
MTEDSAARDARLISSAMKIRYNPMVAAAGSGPWVIDTNGRKYLDFGSAWSLAHLGYSNPDVRAAITNQLERTMFAGLVSAINEPALDLAEKLVSLVPGDFEKKVWFGLSGSDASEAAQRLLLMSTGRRRIVSFICSRRFALRTTWRPSSWRRCRATAATWCPHPISCPSCGPSATGTASCW